MNSETVGFDWLPGAPRGNREIVVACPVGGLQCCSTFFAGFVRFADGIMALSTLNIGRRLWCSIVSNAHAVPKNPSLFRRLPRNVIQIRGLWLSPLRRPYPLHNKNINIRFLATHNNGRGNKLDDTDPEKSTQKTGNSKWYMVVSDEVRVCGGIALSSLIF